MCRNDPRRRSRWGCSTERVGQKWPLDRDLPGSWNLATIFRPSAVPGPSGRDERSIPAPVRNQNPPALVRRPELSSARSNPGAMDVGAATDMVAVVVVPPSLAPPTERPPRQPAMDFDASADGFGLVLPSACTAPKRKHFERHLVPCGPPLDAERGSNAPLVCPWGELPVGRAHLTSRIWLYDYANRPSACKCRRRRRPPTRSTDTWTVETGCSGCT